MRFDLNEDQATFTAVLDQLLSDDGTGFRAHPDGSRFDIGTALETRLEENGFLDAAAEPNLGPVMGAEMIRRISRLPVVVECAASALLRPLLAPGLPRPLAVIDGAPTRPIRFAQEARALLRITTDGLHVATTDRGATCATPSLFAYPMGRIDTDRLDWTPLDGNPEHARALWRTALAAELSGTLQGGLDAVLAHVRERRQFGVPIGSFQGMQHRLATDAVDIEAAHWLTLRAAETGNPGDAALALGKVQNAATRIGYDLHQFMGAMGLTLEHPLHRWTYRARWLRGALGGPTESLLSYADALWGTT